MNSMGLAVYNWRMTSGLSMLEASKTLGIHMHTLADIEKGKRHPRPSTIKKLKSIIGDMETTQPSAPEEAPQEALPFTERLARSRGFASMDDYMQKTKQMIAQRSQDQAPSENSSVSHDELVRLIGFMEGVQTAIHADLSRQISILERLARDQSMPQPKEDVS